MKELWTLRWKKALIWLCGYVSIIAFAVAGGYAVFRTEDRQLHKTAKQVFVLCLIFTAIEAVILVLGYISSLGGGFYASITWINLIVAVGKIALFAAGIVHSLFFGGAERSVQSAPPAQTDAESEDAADETEEK